MKKKDKEKYIILGLLLLGLVFIGNFITLPASIIGGSALSIDNVETSEGNRIIYTVALDGSAGSGTITFTPEQALQYGFQITEPITFELEESCRYQISNESNIVYSLDLRYLGERFADRCCASVGYFMCCSWCENYQCSKVGSGYYQTQISSGIKDAGSGCNFRAEFLKVYCTKYIPQGSVYEIDPTSFFITNVKVKIGNKEEVIELSNVKREASVEGITVKVIGSLMGSQSCPTAGSEAVAYKKNNEDTFTLKDKITYRQMDSMKKNTPANLVYNSGYQSYYDAFINSKSYISDYCEIKTTSLQGTYVECTPYYPVAIPMLQIIIDGDKVGLLIPDGEPEIISIENPPFKESADTSPLKVKFKNVGRTDDSFDVSLICPSKVTPTSQRFFLEKNEIKEVQISYSGSGIIEDCVLKINSVNKPENKDEKEVKIKIYPICSKPQPGINFEKVQTEYGCFWLCKNQYSLDVDGKCQPIKYDEPNYYSYEPFRNEMICVGYGEYAKIYEYVKGINYTREKEIGYHIIPFIPYKKINQHFLPAPYCKYVAEYGYKIEGGNAVPLTNLNFTYHNIISEGIEVNIEKDTKIPIDIGNGNGEEDNELPSDTSSSLPPSSQEIDIIDIIPKDISGLFVFVGGLIIAYVVYENILKKKLRFR